MFMILLVLLGFVILGVTCYDLKHGHILRSMFFCKGRFEHHMLPLNERKFLLLWDSFFPIGSGRRSAFQGHRCSMPLFSFSILVDIWKALKWNSIVECNLPFNKSYSWIFFWIDNVEFWIWYPFCQSFPLNW